MDSSRRFAAVRGEVGMVHWMKKGEGISQRTYMHDPWTQTTVWGWPEGSRGRGWVEVGRGGGMGTSVIVSTISK